LITQQFIRSLISPSISQEQPLIGEGCHESLKVDEISNERRKKREKSGDDRVE